MENGSITVKIINVIILSGVQRLNLHIEGKFHRKKVCVK